MNKFARYISFFLLIGAFTAGNLTAQDSAGDKFSFEFRGELLHEALDRIARTTDIDLVYDPELVRGHHVYKRFHQQPLRDVLRTVLNEFQLDYLTLSTGTIVVVRSVAEGPFYGTLSGKITDSRSGEPLPGATVLLADASGGTTTNRAGSFSINRLLTGRHTITFSYIGYEPVTKTIEIEPNGQHREQISLNPKPVDVTPIVVEAHRPRLPNLHHSETDGSYPEWQISGPLNSPIRSLNLMPGVQYGLPMAGLHLQGGQQSEHRILLDGVPIYNPSSFGQLFSAFSPYAIGNVELHKAGYGVEQGSQIAGLINLSHDLIPTQNNGASMQADPLSVNFRGDATLGNLNIMTALRTNFWDVYKDPNLEQTLKNWDVLDPLITNMMHDLDTDAAFYSPLSHESDVGFLDYHLAVSYEVDPFSTLSGSFYLADNSIETRLLNQDISGQNEFPYLYATDRYDWQNLMARIGWDQMVTPRFELSMQASYSSNQFDYLSSSGVTSSRKFYSTSLAQEYAADRTVHGSIPIRLPTKFDGNSIQHAIISADASYSFSPRFSISSGLQIDRIHSETEISEAAENGIQTEQSSTLLGTYLNSRHTFGNYWSLNWGSRFTYASNPGTLFAEPRFSIQYDQPDSDLGYWSFRISGGLYRQFVNEFRITNPSPTAVVPSFSIWSHSGDLEIPKAWHLNGSFLIEPAAETTLKLEAFYKLQPVTNITAYRNPDTVFQAQQDQVSAFAESTSMTALGGGIRINQAVANSRIKLLAGYDYSYSRVDMATQFGRTLPAPWNEPHRAQFRMMWHILPNLTAVSKWQGIWGRAWAFRQSYYDYLRFDDGLNLPLDFYTPETDTLPVFHQVDFSLIYQPSLHFADAELRLELINILNRTNTLDKYLLPVIANGEVMRYEIRQRQFPGFYPSVSLSFGI